MIFNLDARKQAQKMLDASKQVIFNRKVKKKHSSSSGFHQCYCVSNCFTKTLRRSYLRLKLTSEEHLLNVFKKS